VAAPFKSAAVYFGGGEGKNLKESSCTWRQILTPLLTVNSTWLLWKPVALLVKWGPILLEQ